MVIVKSVDFSLVSFFVVDVVEVSCMFIEQQKVIEVLIELFEEKVVFVKLGEVCKDYIKYCDVIFKVKVDGNVEEVVRILVGFFDVVVKGYLENLQQLFNL